MRQQIMRKDKWLDQHRALKANVIPRVALNDVCNQWSASGFRPLTLLDQYDNFYMGMPEDIAFVVEEKSIPKWIEQIEKFFAEYLNNGIDVINRRFFNLGEIQKYCTVFLNKCIPFDKEQPENKNAGVVFNSYFEGTLWKNVFGRTVLKKMMVFDRHQSSTKRIIRYLFNQHLAWEIMCNVCMFYEHYKTGDYFDTHQTWQSMFNEICDVKPPAKTPEELDKIISGQERFAISLSETDKNGFAKCIPYPVKKFGYKKTIRGKKKQLWRCTDPNAKKYISTFNKVLIIGAVIAFFWCLGLAWCVKHDQCFLGCFLLALIGVPLQSYTSEMWSSH